MSWSWTFRQDTSMLGKRFTSIQSVPDRLFKSVKRLDPCAASHRLSEGGCQERGTIRRPRSTPEPSSREQRLCPPPTPRRPSQWSRRTAAVTAAISATHASDRRAFAREAQRGWRRAASSADPRRRQPAAGRSAPRIEGGQCRGGRRSYNGHRRV